MSPSGHFPRLVSDDLLADTQSVIEATSITRHQREAAAAAILINHSNEDIISWLKLVRSAHRIEPIAEQHPDGAHLSPSQFHALFALKDCPNDRLLHCLAIARLFRNGPITMASAPSPITESGLGNNLSSLFEQSENFLKKTNSWTDSPIIDPSQTGFGLHRPQTDHNHFSEHLFVGSVDSTLSGHTGNHYWCTVCENPNSYKDSGNWKKHEKGHETVFVCGLDDAVHDGWTGQSPSPKQFSCKRRDIMVNHLNKSHGISALQQGRDLADKWRSSVKKQAWSCGFCVKFFLNFQDRLKHIDVEHFKKYENIRGWDYIKVIHGLLLQPKMENAWKKVTASLLPWESPEDIVWGESFARTMRMQLEIGPSDESDADRLADAVYSARKPKEYWNEVDMAPSTVGKTGDSSLSSIDYVPDAAAGISSCGTTYRPNSAATLATNFRSEHSPFDRLPAHAYNDAMVTEPTTISPNEGSPGSYNATSLNLSQEW